ncbi:hypothetical protein KAW64_03510 [bacterium]|nr:hypothetical protein [bacterium]
MTRRTCPPIAVAAIVFLIVGCSDDLVCPELQETPYISALIVQRSDNGDESTRVEVVCTADPVPSGFSAFINGERLPAVVRPDGLGYLATLDADEISWQPGRSCLLQVSTDDGNAGATLFVPEAPVVTEPVDISLGDSLKVLWRSAADADYYAVSAVLVQDAGAGAGGGRGSRDDTLALSRATRETFVVFSANSIVAAGVVSGFVEAVAGPFPEAGAAGNISGYGWGFFTLRYVDSGSTFDVAVSDVP